MIVNKFRVTDEIGRGAFATVYSAIVHQPYPPLNVGDKIAIKSISTSRISSQQERDKLENEINLMKSLNHPNIVKLYGVERTRTYYFLIMEFCDSGDLIHYLHSRGTGLEEDTIRQFSSQIADGLCYLHNHQIVHRDLKPHNILLSGSPGQPILKIADFGFARFLKPFDLAETVCGSPIYMAPEIQFGNKYSANVDMWSVGVILYELITTKTPFPHIKSQYELAQELKMRGSRPYSLPASSQVSPELQDLVSRLLTIDPEKRMNMQEFLKHPFFQNAEHHSEIIDDMNDEIPSICERQRRFSFFKAEGVVDDLLAEKFLTEARDSAQIIANHLSDAQAKGNFLLFELLTLLCEFLLDFLNEYRHTKTRVAKLENEVIEMIKAHAHEAENYEDTDLQQCETSAMQFLFEKGLEFASDGASLEQSEDYNFALIKYQRAMALLRPIAYSVTDDDFTGAVRSLYIQISKRYETMPKLA